MTAPADDPAWAERDRRREALERQMKDMRAAERNHHVSVVLGVLHELVDWDSALLFAEVAVDALIDDGVVFARLRSSGAVLAD